MKLVFGCKRHDWSLHFCWNSFLLKSDKSLKESRERRAMGEIGRKMGSACAAARPPVISHVIGSVKFK